MTKTKAESMRERATTLMLFCLMMAPAAALAHIGEGDLAGGFVSGFVHPILGLDHVIAMVAVGMWGAQLGAPAIWVLPVTFPVVMAFGGALGVLGIPVPGTEIGIALSAVALGLMVALNARPPLWAAATLVGAFAIFHGYAHGTELPDSANSITYSIGFVIATGALHGLGILFGTVNRWKLGSKLLRLGGSLIAFAGIYFLAAQVALK